MLISLINGEYRTLKQFYIHILVQKESSFWQTVLLLFFCQRRQNWIPQFYDYFGLWQEVVTENKKWKGCFLSYLYYNRTVLLPSNLTSKNTTPYDLRTSHYHLWWPFSQPVRALLSVKVIAIDISGLAFCESQ